MLRILANPVVVHSQYCSGTKALVLSVNVYGSVLEAQLYKKAHSPAVSSVYRLLRPNKYTEVSAALE